VRKKIGTSTHGYQELTTLYFILPISLWETREDAEAYNTTGYPEVMKSLEPLLDGSPKLRVADIVNSTFHKVPDNMAA